MDTSQPQPPVTITTRTVTMPGRAGQVKAKLTRHCVLRTPTAVFIQRTESLLAAYHLH